MHVIDWLVVIPFIVGMLLLGVFLSKKATASVNDYFLAGRKLPWWIIGFTNVAGYTGSSAAFVLLIFENGIVGNWLWWATWVVWMPFATILWAKIWRRLRIITDAEFLELRYGGKVAKVLRLVTASYAGVFLSVLGMAMLSTWLTDTVGAVTGISTAKLVIVFATITFVYTLLSGLIGIAYTDIPQFLVYLIANIIFIPFCIKAAGGLSVMYDTVEATRGMAFLQPVPPTDPVPPTRSFATLTFLVFLFQGMWSTVSGSTAQRFAAAKNEYHAIMGQALSTVLSLVVRIAPLIVIGIAAAAIYPPDFAESGKLYGLMILKCAPIGLVGLLIVSELAGYMSSMDTTMNFGASLIVNDVYRRFLKKNASERHYVVVGQIATALMTVAAILVAINIVKGDQSWFLFTNGVLGSFALCVGVLRLTWWRFNKYAELGAMILAFPLGYIVWFKLGYYDKPFWQAFLLLAGTGFVFMVTLALLTPPEDPVKLRKFYKRCLPFGLWGPIKKGVELDEYSLRLLNYKSDFVDIGLSVAFSASLVIAANAIFGLWFRTSAGCFMISILTGWILLKRWQKRGFLSSLNEEEVILARDEFEDARGDAR